MMNIKQISIDQLYSHPENPRLQLGDLTELADSIKKNGVMQNLTVVPGHFMSKEEWTKEARAEGADKVSAEGSYRLADAYVGDGYTVIIGHRRLAAAKMAGLAELPCVISEMDHREQIATMLEENMQRADLTVFEQAQGFQMMMNLGFSAKEISEKTGFGETTVRRRLKMAELDNGAFQKAVGKQITIDELDQLARIDSVKERNALLKNYGENNYNWSVTRAIHVQESKKRKPAARQMLKDAKVEKLPDSERYSYGKYRNLYGNSCKLYEWDGKKNFIPKVEGKLFYTEDDISIDFYVKEEKKKAEAPEKTAEEKEEEKKRALAWKTVDRSAEVAADLREKYAGEITVSPKNAMRMMQWALVAAFVCMTHYDTPTLAIKKELEIKSSVIPEIQEDIYRKLMEMPQSRWPALILMMFTGDYKGHGGRPPMFADGSRGYQFPKYKKNVQMELCYNWLTEFGYSMSTEEIEMMTGTHAVFQTKMGGTGKDESAGADD